MAANFIRKLAPSSPVWIIKFLGNFWFPYLGSGIRIVEAHDDFRYLKVKLKYSWYNRNYVGTQFGGSIYSMTDPFYMILLLQNLGKEYIVWDKAAQIDFLKPGKSTLFAEFKITDSMLEDVKSKTINSGMKYVFDIPVEVLDETGLVIAKVIKTLYVKRK